MSLDKKFETFLLGFNFSLDLMKPENRYMLKTFLKEIENREDIEFSHYILIFEYFWEKSTAVFLPNNLKEKIVLSRRNLDNDLFFLIITGRLMPSRIMIIFKVCRLTEKEKEDMWKVFASLKPHFFSRGFVVVNEFLSFEKILERKFKLFSKINVLDLGCGPKALTIRDFVSMYPEEVQGYGIDLNLEVESSSDVSLIKGNFISLPYQNSFFDLVYSSFVMQYVDDANLPLVLNEVLRVLNKRGYFIFNNFSREKILQIKDELDYEFKIFDRKELTFLGEKTLLIIKK